MLRYTQSHLLISKNFLHDREIVIGYTDNINLHNIVDDTVTERDVSDERVPPSGISMTALQQRNEELAAALKEARSADRARTTFFAMVTHEMRTPLNAITGFSDAALHGIHGPLSEAYRGYFSAIHDVGQHLESLVDALLDLAQLEAGRFTVEPRPISAKLAVAEARSMIMALAVQQGIDISAVAVTGDWLLLVDPTRLRQILVNLLANAVKFTPSGGTVGIDETPCPPDYLDLTVWDTGIGVPPDEQERIFEAFHQIGRPAQSGAKGVGLGLAIARQLARAMDGDILLASEPGKGSRFTVRLPVLPETAPAA
jgi:signal transduction histidine kinase